MTKSFVKAGIQNPDDPLEYVLSTSEVDRMGDIVEQNWDLEGFKQNPIALFQHDPSRIIGTWDQVRVSGGRLLGKLKLGEAGSTSDIDDIRSLVAQKILRAVSVGFRVKDYEPLEDGRGYRLKGPILHEVSLVSVPANPSALQIARKSLHMSDQDIRKFFEVETDPLQAQRNKLKFLKTLSAR